MQKIELTNGATALVDDDDFGYLDRFTWYYDQHDRNIKTSRGPAHNQTVSLMPRVIMLCPKCLVVKHLNDDPLDNQKANLQLVTQDMKRYKGKPGQIYKGLAIQKSSGKWMAQIYKGGTCRYLGNYDEPIIAAVAYDAKARPLGRRLNFTEEEFAELWGQYGSLIGNNRCFQAH